MVNGYFLKNPMVSFLTVSAEDAGRATENVASGESVRDRSDSPVYLWRACPLSFNSLDTEKKQFPLSV